MAKSRHWIGEKLLIFNALCLKLAPMPLDPPFTKGEAKVIILSQSRKRVKRFRHRRVSMPETSPHAAPT